mmetsp:Transcript_50836/g.95333  ORF Transcript_50836/g.95333 Transcript_50836/m.95333 type:complete len:98 (-) Transcript_50836:141-434(-)
MRSSASAPSLRHTFANVSWMLMKSASASVQALATKRKEKEGYLFLGKIAYSLMGGSDSEVSDEVKEWATKHTGAQEQMEGNVSQKSLEDAAQETEKN